VDVSSPLTPLRQTLTLVYKIILTLAAGSLLIAILSAYFHYARVRNGVGNTERLIGQGRLAEADALAYRLAFDPESAWARCFPGYYRALGLLRIRCLVRSGQADAARGVAEMMRLTDDDPVMRRPLGDLLQRPLPWLQSAGLSLVSNFTTGFFPIERPGLWSGYETLFAELVAVRDAATLETLANELARQFPRSPIAIYANSARAEVTPGPSPLSALTRPEPVSFSPVSTQPDDLSPSSPPAEQPAAPEPEPEPVPPPPPPAAWGIVTNARAMAYNPENGKPIRQLKAGDVFVIEGSVSSASGPLLTGTLILNNRNVPDLAFQSGDLEIRKGVFNSVPLAEVALRSRLAEIATEEAALADQAAAELDSLTSEEKAYRLSVERMENFQKESQDLQAKMAKASGNERIAILDRLRQMKYQEQAILRDMQKKKEAVDATVKSGGSKPGFTSRLTALRQEKQAILKRLAAPAS
jgi:hypothetical protein